MICQKLCQTNLSGWGSPIFVVSIIHHPLVMDVSSTPCVTDLPTMIIKNIPLFMYIFI